MSKLTDFLQYTFKDEILLNRALTHSSMSNQGDRNFDRLEFLGDRVLGVVIAKLLFDTYPDEPEGELARRHSSLVSRVTLARVADTIGLAKEMKAASFPQEAELADACEALIAALYIDGGIEAAQQFVVRVFAPLMREDLTPPKDAKSALQEYAQAQGWDLPNYELVERSGPDHKPKFTVRVAVGTHEPVEAVGASKRLAEQQAATELLEKLLDND